MSNKKKSTEIFSNELSSFTQDFIIKMWILHKGCPRPTKMKTDVSKVKDLNNLAYVIKEEFKILKNVILQNIVFFNYNDSIAFLLPNSNL